MNKEELKVLHKLSTKLLPEMDSDLLKSILIALALMTEQNDDGEELKSVFKEILLKKL